MTKINKKKLNKSTIAIIFLAVALIASIAFGATFALFTANTKQLGKEDILAGSIKLSSTGAFAAELNNILPGQDLLGMSAAHSDITVTPTVVGEGGEFIACRVTIDGTKASESGSGSGAAFKANEMAGMLTILVPTSGEGASATASWIRVNDNSSSTTDTSLTIDFAYVGDGLANRAASTVPAAATSGTALTVFEHINFDATDNYDESIYTSGTNNGYYNDIMGCTFNVSIQFRAVQAYENSYASCTALVTALFTTLETSNFTAA